jgi:DnaJ-class molecular chaperone
MPSLVAFRPASAPSGRGAAPRQSAALRRHIGVRRCTACGGDGAIAIEPIHEDGGVIWSIMPCEECLGTGFVRRPA